jgi:hypothetical protein
MFCILSLAVVFGHPAGNVLSCERYATLICRKLRTHQPFHVNPQIYYSLLADISCLTFRHRASSVLGQTFRYSPENAFYIFNQQIYFVI